MRKIKLDDAILGAEVDEISLLSIANDGGEIAGISVFPLTPGRMLLLEAVGSSLVSSKSDDVDPIFDVFQSFWILASDDCTLKTVLDYAVSRRRFLQSMKLLDCTTEQAKEVCLGYAKRHDAYVSSVMSFAEEVKTLDIIEIKKQLVAYVDLSMSAHKLMAQKKTLAMA